MINSVSKRNSTFIDVQIPVGKSWGTDGSDMNMSHPLYFTENSRLDERIVAVKKYLDENPTCREEVAELALKAGLSTRYFSIKFKKEFGMTPKQYQIKSRMNYALRMLQNGKMQCSEISEQLHYPDQFTFSKQFKRTFGIAPSHIQLRRA